MRLSFRHCMLFGHPLIVHTRVCLFLGSLLCSINLKSFFFGTSTMLFLLLYLCITLKGLLWFHVNFRITCYSSVKCTIGILMGIELNLWIALGSMGSILTVLILLIQEYGIFFHLLVSSSLSFISVLFSICSSFISLVKFIF